MKIAHVTLFEDFGARSLATHALMVLALANAILAGSLLDGRLGLVSFVALLNFTAGLWIAQSIHSLGNEATDDGYEGVLNELVGSSDSDGERDTGFDTGRFGRLLTLIAAVTAVSLLTSARILPGEVLPVAIVAVGSISVVTAIIGFLIALGSSYDAAARRHRWRRVNRNGLDRGRPR